MSLVTLAQAKVWLRVDHEDEDDLIESLIDEAEEYLEAATGRTWANSKRAQRFVLAYVDDAYRERGTDVDGRRGLSRTLQSIMVQLQNTPEPDEPDEP